MRARASSSSSLCARSACVRGCVGGLSASAFEGVRVSVLLRGLGWYLRDMEGTRRVLEGYSRALEGHSSGSRGVRMLLLSGPLAVLAGSWGTLGYSGGTPRMCVRACVAVPLLGRMTHHDGDARHCKASLSANWLNRRGTRRVLTSAYVSCNPSLRVRLRRDALADARAHHRRAGRCAVGCVLPCAPPSAHCSTVVVHHVLTPRRPRVPLSTPMRSPY